MTAINPQSFLAGGGETGALIRSKDWSATPLGPVDQWPQSLKTCVRIILTSRQPMFIWWGPELINIHNDAYIDILQGKHPEALGRPAAEIWTEIWEQVGPRVETAIKRNEGTYDEALLLIMQRKGYPEETYYTFSYSPVPGDDGKPDGILCANTDDTARIIDERHLTTLKDIGKNLLGLVSDQEVYEKSIEVFKSNPKDFPFALFYRIENNGQLATLTASTVLGKASEQVPSQVNFTDASTLFQPMYDAVHTFKPQAVENIVGKFGEMPHGFWDRSPDKAMILPIFQKGSDFPYALLVVGINPYRPLNEKYKSFFQLVADQIGISINNVHAYKEEKRRAEALAEIDRAKTTFFSNISHEFRTPLTLMLSPLEEVLTSQEKLSDRTRDNLQISLRNTLRLQKLVNTLLDFSRIEAGRMQATFQPVEIASFTEDLASTFRSAVEKAGINYVVNVSPINAPVYIDTDMWEKIVLNLLSNAFKYTESGEIEVSIRRKEEAIELTVKDSGIGIAEDEVEKIFERFHQIKNTQGRSQEGSGIGLSLVQELVKLHGGRISVTSKVGVGSAFTVTLPLGKDHLPADRVIIGKPWRGMKEANAYVEEAHRWLPQAAADFKNDGATESNTVSQTGAQEKKLKVLLVDDNADIRDYVKRLLSEDYQVITVSNGRQALDYLKEQSPALIISDVMMPEIDGFELVKRLKKESRTKDIPIILLSARAGEEATVEGLKTGADDYLVKPFSAKELISRIDSNVKIARSRKASEEHLRSVFKQIPVGTCILKGPEHIIELANEKALEILGKTEKDILYKPAMEALPELLAQGFLRIPEQVYRTGKSHKIFEIPVTMTKEGKPEYMVLNLVSEPLIDPNGKVSGLIVIAFDVTPEVLAKKALEESEKKYRDLIANSPTSIAILKGRDMVVTIANEAIKKTWGKGPDVIGKPLVSIMPEVKAQGFIDLLQNVYETGEPFYGHETPVQLLRNGIWETVYFNFVYQAHYDEKNNIEGVAIIATEVTPQALLNRKIEQNEKYFRQLTESVPVMIWMTDSEGCTTYLNKKWYEFTGQLTEDGLGFGWLDAVHSEERDQVRRAFHDAIENRTGFQVEYRLKHKQGEYQWMLDDGFPRFDIDGNFEGHIGSVVNINQQKLFSEELEKLVTERTLELSEANEHLERSNKELEQFAYVTSHDLQEPLRKIQTYANLLMDKNAEELNSTSKGYIDRINNASQRMSKLIHDLLNFSKLGTTDRAFVRVDLNAILKNVEIDFEVVIRQKNATIRTSGLPLIEANPLQMNQLFYNLVSNSLKFTNGTREPVIEITAEKLSTKERNEMPSLDFAKSYYKIRFIDNGIGFDQRYVHKIFEIFQRLNSKLKYEGTGIGLALCNKIVTNHGGVIYANSQEGVGSTFTIILPETQES